MPTPNIALQRVLSKVVKLSSGCWLYLGSVDSNGYGSIKTDRVDRQVHRVTWEGIKGPIPQGRQLGNTCGRRNCANPDHWTPITHTGGRRKYADVPSRDVRRKYKYGMEPGTFDRMLQAQVGLCAICQREFGENLFVDHNHETNSIRGLLCNECNKGLGCFGDSVSRLQRAIDYLSLWGAQ